MRKCIFITLCLFIAFCTSAQTSRSQFIGINVLQLPALTINANYSIESTPFLTPIVDVGYAFNYEKSIDIFGNLLTPHCDCGNDGFGIEKRTGAYLKIGAFLNLRKSYEKQNFFHVGLFLNNSVVYESGDYVIIGIGKPIIQPVSQVAFVPGFSFSGGYEFSFSKRLKSNIDFQISLPGKNHKHLYGYSNYIPGMGYRDFEKYWFPMLLWNVKYRL